MDELNGLSIPGDNPALYSRNRQRTKRAGRFSFDRINAWIKDMYIVKGNDIASSIQDVTASDTILHGVCVLYALSRRGGLIIACISYINVPS